MTSFINLTGPQRVAIKQDNANDWFYCQFCPMTFGTQSEHKSHTFGHFDTRNCADCNVHLIRICDEWYEVHSVANCQNNNHIHTFNTNNTNHDSGDIVVVKQEPEDEMGPVELNELLNVKADVDFEDFGEIFATNLNTIEVNENNGCSSHSLDHSYGLTAFERSPQHNYQVVSVTQKGQVEKKRTKGFPCRFCDKILGNRFQLDSHIQSHHLNNQTKCNHCGQKFVSNHLLENHLRFCRFNNRKRSYTSHPHRPTKNFTCGNRKRSYTSHPHRPTKNFTCDICGSTVTTFARIKDHMNELHSSKLTFKCRICRRLYPNRYYLNKHMLRHKQALKNGQADDTLMGDLDDDLIERRKYVRVHPHRPSADFTCDICGKVVSRFEALEEHMILTHSARDSFYCRICGRVYPNRYYLSKHIARHKNAAANGINMLEEDLDKDLMERNKYVRIPPEERKAQLTCSECGKQFRHHSLLMEHKSSRHSGKSGFQCRKCGRFYPNRYYLMKHLRRHEEAENSGVTVDQLPLDLDEGLMARTKYVRRANPYEQKSEYECDQCDRVYKKFHLLTEHKRSHHQLGHQCRKCHRFYPSRYYLAKHMKRHNENTDVINDLPDGGKDVIQLEPHFVYHLDQTQSEFTCDLCGISYKNYDLLKEHMTTNHSNIPGFMCRICNQVYPNDYYLAKHMKQHDRDESQERNEEIEDRRKRNTARESEMVIEIDQMQDDEQNTATETVAIVELDKINDNGRNTEIEAEIVVRPEKTATETEKKVKLNKMVQDLDEDLIKRNQYMRVHPHRPTSNFTCDICQRVLSSYYSIRYHMEVHVSKILNKYICPKCKREFPSKKYLERHQNKMHSNAPAKVTANEAPKPKSVETKQMCSICGRLFTDKSRMLAHEQTHLGVRTTCPICGKEFVFKHYLKKHIRSVHEGQRPFACEVDGCEWRFKQVQCLKRHQARLHGMVKNRNPCPICGREFPDSTYHLKRHLKCHANNTAKEFTPGMKRDSFRTTKKS